MVGTPIGNLADLTPRAGEALKNSDFVAAEDTRVSLKLLNYLKIKRPLISYHEHNKREQGMRICERILAGETCALVTDAGMPAISDPGADLVRMCREKDIPVVCAPGPTALTTALAISGMPCRRFVFEGFLPTGKERINRLKALQTEERTIVLYEAPHRLQTTLRELTNYLGDRPAALCRELTKRHEEVLLTDLAQACTHYACEPPRGEFVLIIGGTQFSPKSVTPLKAAESAKIYLSKGFSKSEAARLAAAETGVKKSEIYRLLIEGEKP